MGIENPNKLSDEDYKKEYANYLYLRKLEFEFQKRILKEAIAEALSGKEDE